ncbi:thiol-disulfide oxidoreductase ResA [Rummeliibacillus suwonensis]|uniref:thiol-disulfide oxidoreductase ResA n=1 Tax=Rummeliibacillus suwonensis TaxID=1306154 RepID=UPI001AAEDB46|nr:thiol-disulfide oxidoreductase ResA [Rummeliibacillus suwonensis]MBO2537616.1 thiol-disulfide oxidoreductase ResA [Rummeliibacillus suwonensis]
MAKTKEHKAKNRKILRGVIAFILLVAVGYVLYNEIFIKQQATQTAADGPKAPQFSLSDLDGVEHKLADYKGKGVLINFWATYCPPCKKEMPYLESAYKDYKDQGVEVLAIDAGEPMLIVNQFLADKNVSFPILLDDGDVLDSYQIINLPKTFLVNKDGVIIDKIDGEMTEKDIRKYMERIKAK